MPAQKIGAWLSSGELRVLSGRAQRLMKLQQVFSDSVPPSLAAASRVKNFRAGTLFLFTDNAAIATKLKQLAPRLLAHIRNREPEVTKIHVEVQVTDSAEKPPGNAKLKRLGVDAVENFERLADAMPDSDLKSALAQLARRHRQQK